jgi:hypothetical protein
LEPWKKLPLSPIDPPTLQTLFKTLRDAQPLVDSSGRGRRATWLYPDDGCYARSAIAQKTLEAEAQGQFQQIFLFGNLVLKTKNHPHGKVQWWYHVAPVIHTSFGVYVMDPALDALQPMRINAWIDRLMSNRKDGKVSLCSAATFSPDSYCTSADAIEYDRAVTEELDVYLDLEWERLEDLGRNPNKELGEDPPWASRLARMFLFN